MSASPAGLPAAGAAQPQDGLELEPLALDGAYRVTFPRPADERGHFERVYCRDSFLARGLEDCSRQSSLSFNRRAGTLRGLHLQLPPHGETKLVRCVAGRVFDVLVDLRPGSPTFGAWHGGELSADNGHAFYIPRGFAHGFVSLTDAALLLYQIADPYVPSASAGIAWDDADLAIAWPRTPEVIGAADRNRPSLAAMLALLQPE